MGKKLLTKDYDSFVLETFSMPSDDFNNHYLNKMEEYYPDNKDIGEQLKRSIERYFDWYKEKVCSRLPVWGCDENGENATLIDPLKTYTPLDREFGVTRSVNGDFFTFQIAIIERLATVFNLSERLEKVRLDLEKRMAEQASEEADKKGKGSKTKDSTPQKLEDIFIKPEYANLCFGILTKLSKPAINESYTNYVSGPKHVFAIWIDVLKGGESPFINKYSNEIYTSLLNTKFIGLNTTKDIFTRVPKQREVLIQEIKGLITSMNLRNLQNL